MNVTKVQLIVTDKISNNNRMLYSFIEKNIVRLNKMGVLFDFIIASPQHANDYKSRGITLFPTMIFNGRKITGLTAIQNYIMYIIKHGLETPASSVEEDLSNWQRSIIGKVKKGESGTTLAESESMIGEDLGDADINKKIQKFNQNRMKFVPGIQLEAEAGGNIGGGNIGGASTSGTHAAANNDRSGFSGAIPAKGAVAIPASQMRLPQIPAPMPIPTARAASRPTNIKTTCNEKDELDALDRFFKNIDQSTPF